ncbi:serine/threonine-protein kinase pim-3-like [Misgurnus anguillicaudatus]|uniref:serine/threonine-protein kinase pim-3-like n=1 Tax=Misgurnus anguillicaudatus TaxID=75329 RepID=UPI003CCF22FA
MPLVAEVAINQLLLKPKKSPHIVEMLDWFTEDDEHIMVLEYPAPCVTLTKFIRDKRRISEELARDFMHQAILGAKDCFRRGVYHGDIKLDNILINTDTMKLKLIDFGVSKLTKACTVHGVDKEELGPCVAETICSLGALLYKILHGDDQTKPYYAFSKSDRARTSSKECEEFMDLCFQDDGGRKPKLDDLLKHPWMMKK